MILLKRPPDKKTSMEDGASRRLQRRLRIHLYELFRINQLKAGPRESFRLQRSSYSSCVFSDLGLYAEIRP